MKRGKKYQEAAKKVDKTKLYSLQDAAVPGSEEDPRFRKG